MGRPGARGCGGRCGRARDHPPRHAGRPGHLDARDRQGHHRGADARRRLRLAERRARRIGRPLRDPGGGRGRDGAADEHRLRVPDLDRRRGHRRRPGREDRERRGRLRPCPDRGARAKPRPRRGDGPRGDQRHRCRGARGRADRHRRHRHRPDLLDAARRLRGPGAEGDDARHRRAHSRRARHAVPVRALADHRQPERRLPSDPGRDHRPRRSRSSAPG